MAEAAKGPLLTPKEPSRGSWASARARVLGAIAFFHDVDGVLDCGKRANFFRMLILLKLFSLHSKWFAVRGREGGCLCVPQPHRRPPTKHPPRHPLPPPRSLNEKFDLKGKL